MAIIIIFIIAALLTAVLCACFDAKPIWPGILLSLFIGFACIANATAYEEGISKQEIYKLEEMGDEDFNTLLNTISTSYDKENITTVEGSEAQILIERTEQKNRYPSIMYNQDKLTKESVKVTITLPDTSKSQQTSSFCTNCGSGLAETDNFCGNCGTKIN